MTHYTPHRIIAITLALLMFISSTGLSMDVHYCQDQLKGISLLGKAKSCHEAQASQSCHKKNKSCHHSAEATQTEKDNCCHNESLVVDKIDLGVSNTQITTFQDIQFDFVAAFVAVYVLNYSVEVDFQSYQHYKPPLPDRDIQVLFQRFLI